MLKTPPKQRYALTNKYIFISISKDCGGTGRSSCEIAMVVDEEWLQGQGQMDKLKVIRQHVVHAEVNVKLC